LTPRLDIVQAENYLHDVMAARQITVRGVSPELGRRLAELSRARGKSLNSTVLELLETAAGVDQRMTWLRRFMTWSAGDVRAMDQAVAAQRKVDAKPWR
jgi:hypothetical protein